MIWQPCALVTWKTLVSWVTSVFQTMTPPFIMQYPKAAFLHITLFEGKSLQGLGTCQAHSGGSRFSKIVVFARKLNYHHWKKEMFSCFPGSDGLTLFIFKKISTKCPTLNNHSLSLILSSKNGILWNPLCGSDLWGSDHSPIAQVVFSESNVVHGKDQMLYT